MLTLMTYSIVGSHWFLLNLPFLEGKCSMLGSIVGLLWFFGRNDYHILEHAFHYINGK